jgi:hypothetical protein
VDFCYGRCVFQEPKNLGFEDHIHLLHSSMMEDSFGKLSAVSSYDGIDLASQTWCWAGTRTDNEDSTYLVVGFS